MASPGGRAVRDAKREVDVGGDECRMCAGSGARVA